MKLNKIKYLFMIGSASLLPISAIACKQTEPEKSKTTVEVSGTVTADNNLESSTLSTSIQTELNISAFESVVNLLTNESTKQNLKTAFQNANTNELKKEFLNNLKQEVMNSDDVQIKFALVKAYGNDLVKFDFSKESYKSKLNTKLAKSNTVFLNFDYKNFQLSDTYKADKEFIFDVKSDLLSTLNVFLSNVKEPSKVIGSSPKPNGNLSATYSSSSNVLTIPVKLVYYWRNPNDKTDEKLVISEETINYEITVKKD
ncbi:hypothetical protein [Mycoplasmopsis felis]|uniref:hypothetical protein n=1 Tax=Mycoplasmopsis felis TaxID=33923 RepID=UPI002AFDD60F|nr:hypothetical protein [Mycoplasmopsis felis]WQQ03020.1 hypothetical protein RRG38_02585 [Mycoplasmopsis felis]